VISGNDQLWKQICRQHGFITAKPASFVPSTVSFTEPCIDCIVNQSSNDHLQLITDSTTTTTEAFTAAGDDHCSDAECQSEGYHCLPSYKKMFLNRRRIFFNFTSTHSLTTSVISGHSDRITAIDYHNGYVATG